MRSVAGTTLVMLMLGALMACGPTPEQGAENAPVDQKSSQASEVAGGSEAAAATGYDAVLAEIEGLDQQARWDRLVELAEQEEGTFQVYGTLANDQLSPLLEDFVATTGSDQIRTEQYRAGSADILQRIMQESQAGQPFADAVITVATDLNVLGRDGLLQPFETPLAANLSEDVVFDDWAGVYINAYTLAWNSDLVEDAEVPSTWEQVLSNTAQPIGIEVKSYDWFATLVTKYFVEEQGMSEEEAIALFTDAPAQLIPVSGRSTLAEFVAAGEYGLAVGTYTQNVDTLQDQGAPINWEPPVQPLVQRPNGVAPMADSDTPATALLFVDYMLGESGQKLIASFNRIPTNVNVEGALPPEYDVLTVDVADMVDQREKWTDLYSQVTGEPAGGEG